MSGLAEAFIRSFFGTDDPPTVLRIGLTRAGNEIAVGGYERKIISRGTWTLAGGTARARVQFGPFADDASFDAAALFRGDELLVPLPFEGKLELPKGMSFDYEALVDASDVGR